MKKRRVNIRFSDYFTNQIGGRSSVDMVLKGIKKSGDYSLDFENIDFLSRSAAHQLLTLKNTLKRKGVDISFINVSDSIKLMFEKVANSMARNTKHSIPINRIDFKGEDELKNYLLNI